jgi:hypothetical protein
MFTSALVIGCGGTGAQLIPQLARLLQYHRNSNVNLLTIADGDDLEPRNLERQPYASVHCGQNKAAALSAICLESFGLPTACHEDFVDADYFNSWLDQSVSPLVVCCSDNDATRKLTLSEIVNRRNGIWVSPGNSDGLDSIKGQVLWSGFHEGQQVGIDLAEIYPNLSSPSDVVPSKGGCMAEAPSRPQLLCANSLAAAWTLAVIQNLLDGTLYQTSHGVWFNARTEFGVSFT